MLTKENSIKELGKLSLNNEDEVQQDGSENKRPLMPSHIAERSDLHMHTMTCTHGLQINKINIILKHLGQWDGLWGKSTLLTNPGHLNLIPKSPTNMDKEPTLKNCPLTSIYTPWHTVTIIYYAHIIIKF